MSVELWTGGEFEHHHEIEDLATFIKNMVDYYGSDPTRFCVLANFMVNYSPIDLAIVKNNGIAVIEMKRVRGPVFGGENGDWLIRDHTQQQILRGGSKGNPYNQVIAYRIAFLKFLRDHRTKFLQPRAGLEPRLDHVYGIVVLAPTIPAGSEIDLPDTPWLKISGLDNLHQEIFLARSSHFSLQSKEITRLLREVLRLRKEDIGKYVATSRNKDSLETKQQAPERRANDVVKSVPTILVNEDGSIPIIAQQHTCAKAPCVVCGVGRAQCALSDLTGYVEAITMSCNGEFVLKILTNDFDYVTLKVHPNWNDYVSGLKSWLDLNDRVRLTILHVQKEYGRLYVGQDSLLVIEPDWLINVTDLTKVEFCRRQLLLDRFLPASANEHMIRGNLVHLLFPDLWHGKRGMELAERRENLMREMVEDFIATESAPEDINEKCDSAIEHITRWIDHRKRSTRLRTETFVLSPFLGMKGKIDFLWEEPTSAKVVGIGELKTGKSHGEKPQPGHELQLLAYTMMLFMRAEITFEQVKALLLYSGNSMLASDGRNLHRRIHPTFNSIKNLVNIRNDLVMSELTRSAKFETNMNKCRNCRQLKTHCAVVALLCDENDTRPIETTEWLPENVKQPSNREKVFFQHYIALISQELKAVKEIHADLWRKSPGQREEEGLSFRVQGFRLGDRQRGGYCYELKGANATDLGVGDAVIISDKNGPTHGRVTIGTIRETSKQALMVYSAEEIRFEPKWVDRYTNENLTIGSYKALYRWITHRTNLHDVILGEQAPQFTRLPLTDRSFQKILDKERLNNDQTVALQSILSAESYCIVQGPPGTGKTKLLRAIVLGALTLNQRVLICTGTNRALDEAMRPLVKGEIKNQVLRLGDPGSITDEEVRSVTLRSIIKNVEPLESKISVGIRALKNRSVVGITASSLQLGKYTKVIGEFDLVVIDEAAQLTVPATVGCISFGKRFVLIGDHRQLPPVIQSEGLASQDESDHEGPWPRLSKSLFEILYERASARSGREIILLKDQYRMNEHICSIPSRIWYGGTLRPATAEIAEARLTNDLNSLDGPTRSILDPDESVKFVNVPCDSRGGPRTNATEAKIVCDIVKALISAGFSLAKEDAIAIICPRRAQVELIRRELEPLAKKLLSGSGNSARILLDSVSTVDRFQGSQRDVVIVSLGMADGLVSQHLADERRLNVAISRPRRKLIMLGNREALSEEFVFSTLFETMNKALPYSSWHLDADAIFFPGPRR